MFRSKYYRTVYSELKTGFQSNNTANIQEGYGVAGINKLGSTAALSLQ
jgi:hypothetical protein